MGIQMSEGLRSSTHTEKWCELSHQLTSCSQVTKEREATLFQVHNQSLNAKLVTKSCTLQGPFGHLKFSCPIEAARYG